MDKDQELVKKQIKHSFDQPNIQTHNSEEFTQFRSTNVRELSPQISSEDQPNQQHNPYHHANFTTHPIRSNLVPGPNPKITRQKYPPEVPRIRKSELMNEYRRDEFSEGTGFRERNSNGSMLTEEFKRNFVKKLLYDVRGQSSRFICSMVQREADRIRVFPNEVSCWLATYKIVFKIQQQISNSKFNNHEVVQLFEQHLLSYLNQNIHLKQYKFLKIACGITKSLRLKKCTGSYWLQQFINKYKSQLDPRISLLGDRKGMKVSHYQNMYVKTPKRKRRKKMQILGDCLPTLQREDESNGYRSDEEQKKRIINEVDEKIEYRIEGIIREKAGQLKIQVPELKQWYNVYGRYNLLKNKGRQGMKESSQQCRQVENELIKMIKRKQLQSKTQIAKQAFQIVENLRISELKQFSALERWLQGFMGRNCVLLNEKVKLKGRNEDLDYKKKVPSLFSLNVQGQDKRKYREKNE